MQLKHLCTLRGWRKLRPRHLEDMEDFLTVLDRVLIVLQDRGSGELSGQRLNLTAKEKMPEEDVQACKLWPFDRNEKDTFKALVRWVKMRVQIIDEAREETGELRGRKTGTFDERRDDRRRVKGFNASHKTRKCIVEHCKENHPPWACKVFKEMTVPKKRNLIARSGHCFHCLAAGHHSRDCPNVRRCGIDGCLSNKHSSYLHEWHRQLQDPANPSNQTRSVSMDLLQGQNQSSEVMSASATVEGGKRPTPPMFTPRTRIPAFITNGSKKLKVNVMLDSCSTGSYVTEHAAAELILHGQSQGLTITGTREFEVEKRSRLVEFPVASLDGSFSVNLQANVLDNITSDTPAFQWSELKTRWLHLESIPS